MGTDPYFEWIDFSQFNVDPAPYFEPQETTIMTPDGIGVIVQTSPTDGYYMDDHGNVGGVWFNQTGTFGPY